MRELLRIVPLGLFALLVVAYQGTGRRYYAGFRVPQGYGMYHLLPEEVTHYFFYLVFGLAGVALLYLSLRGLALIERLVSLLDRLSARPWIVACLAAAFVLLVGWAIGGQVLIHSVITDDEHTYRFIAQTLRTGAVTAPSPGGDLEFYREQFVVLNPHVRYGKYPIGHPLLLALGQAVGAEYLVGPLVTALICFPLCWLSLQLVDAKIATLALLMYAATPQNWITPSTYHTQTTSALATLTGIACLAMVGSASRVRLAAAGLCFGYAILVRPLPGSLFAVVAVCEVFRRGPASLHERVRRVGALAIPLAAVASVLLIVNRQQTGQALVSGYQAFHTPEQGAAGILEFMNGGLEVWCMSLVASVVRLNFWLLGWPVSLAACFLARGMPHARLLGGCIGAAFLYRLIAPKAGVGGAGPLYLFEIVPLLCLVAAYGLVRFVRSGDRRRGPMAATLATAATLVGLALFVPVKLADLAQMGHAQAALPRAVRQMDLHRALVFHEAVVPPWAGVSWAYYPPHNSPRLDDDVLFVRFLRDAGGPASNIDFWRRRHPDRSAWYYGWQRERGPFLVPLETFIAIGAAQPTIRADPGGSVVPAPGGAS